MRVREGFLEKVVLELRITKIFNKGKGRGRHLAKAIGYKGSRLERREQMLKASAVWQGTRGQVDVVPGMQGGSTGQEESQTASH